MVDYIWHDKFNIKVPNSIRVKDNFSTICECGSVIKTSLKNLKRNKYPCRQCSINDHIKYFVNEQVFKAENGVSFYLLGAWFSDGNVLSRHRNTRVCSIQSLDKDWLILLRDILCPNKPVTKKKDRNCYELSVNSKSFYDWLYNWGCIEKKSLVITLPSIPKKYLPDFIRGVIDGDGSISIYKNSYSTKKYGKVTRKVVECYICSGSKKFITDLINSLSLLGFRFNFQTKITTKILGKKCKPKKTYRAVATCSKAVDILSWAYYDDNIPSLNRKKKLAQTAIKMGGIQILNRERNSEI